MKNVYSKLFEFRKLTGKVVKSANNPFFKSKYSDLNSVIDATDPALEEVGLVYIDRVEGMNLVSEVWDFDSGEFIQATIPLILTKQDMQQLGGAVTYARRYNRMALLGLQAVDDDGNHVSGKAKPPVASQEQVLQIQALITETRTDLQTILDYFNVKAISELSATNAVTTINKLEKSKQ